MSHLKSTGKELKDYLWKKAQILRKFGIETSVSDNVPHAAYYCEFKHSASTAKVTVQLPHAHMASMEAEDVKWWIDKTFEDAMIKIFQHIEQKVDNKEIKLVAPPSPAAGYLGVEGVFQDYYEPPELTMESFKEAVKEIKEKSEAYYDNYKYMPYGYVMSPDGQTWKVSNKPATAANANNTGMGLISKTFNLNQFVVCAKCDREQILKTAVIHMNDDEGMTREEIADYLESQDLDLQMKIAAE